MFDGIRMCGGGIIPAYAGTTVFCWAGPSSGRDHPRLRGDHFAAFSAFVSVLGSSPPTRGPPRGPRRHLRVLGIIPAYAGTTNPSGRICGNAEDHPRLRGDHAILAAVAGS